MIHITHTIAAILIATVWGSMLFFAAVIAPSVFRWLEPAIAGAFIRRLFPVYYLSLGSLCALATLSLAFLLPAMMAEFLLLLVVTLGFFGARQILMPRINQLRDAANSGDAAAEIGFQRWHQASVWLNAIQLLIILYVLIRLVL